MPDLNYNKPESNFKTIRDLHQFIILLTEAHNRVVSTVTEGRAYLRGEFTFLFSTFDTESFEPTHSKQDLHGLKRFSVDKAFIYEFVQMFEENEEDYMSTMRLGMTTRESSYKLEDICRAFKLVSGMLAREGARRWSTPISYHFRNGRLIWLRAIIAQVMVCAGLSGQKAHQLMKEWVDGKPELPNDMNYDPDGLLLLRDQESVWKASPGRRDTKSTGSHRMSRLIDQFGLATAKGLVYLLLKFNDNFLNDISTQDKVDRMK